MNFVNFFGRRNFFEQFPPVFLTVLIYMRQYRVSTLLSTGKKSVVLVFCWVNDQGDFGINEMVNLDIHAKGK